MQMSYYFDRTVEAPFDQAVARTRDALAAAGFGVITEIDMKKALKEKIGVDFRPYLILGACNPRLAHAALEMEDKIGAMLPCNVVVQEIGPGRTEVAAVDPVASMQAVDNPELLAHARLVGERLQSAVASI
jgi:uncharacterized protein (DUF302 family)